MAPRKKFFILDHTLTDEHIPSFLLRVVDDKYDPLASYAPEELIANELLPDLLPKPSINTNRKDCLETVGEAKARITLAKLFHLEADRKHEDRTATESKEVKRYSIDNAVLRFIELMEDLRYADEVRGLLEWKRSRRAYLVVGFMTATDATWSTGGDDSGSTGGGVSVAPDAAFQRASAGLEVTADTGISSSANRGSEWVAPGEEIFAVSYMEVKLQGKGFWGRGPKARLPGTLSWRATRTGLCGLRAINKVAAAAKTAATVRSGMKRTMRIPSPLPKTKRN